jgi:hypothetical protein
MRRIGRELVFVDLATVPGEDKQLESAAEGVNAAGEAAGAAGQTGQVMA